MVAKNARATAFGKTKEMDELTASLDPTYKICKPSTVNRIAQALEHKILEKIIAKHAELREQRGSPFTVRVLFSLFSCDRAINASGVTSMSEARAARVRPARHHTRSSSFLILLLIFSRFSCFFAACAALVRRSTWTSGLPARPRSRTAASWRRSCWSSFARTAISICASSRRSSTNAKVTAHAPALAPARTHAGARAPARPFRVAFDPTRKFCTTGGFTNVACD